MSAQSTTAPTAPRFVLVGKPAGAERPNVYLITLDGDQVVETDNLEIARRAKQALDGRWPMAIDIETGPNGRPRIVQMERLASEAPATSAPAAPSGHMTRSSSQGMAVLPPLPTGLIHDATRLSSLLSDPSMRDHYNILSPVIAVSQMAEGFGVNLVKVEIDWRILDEETGRGIDTYRSAKIHKPHERALSKSGLLKISQALGIQWEPPRRLDNQRERNFWIWQYVGYLRTYDGQVQPLTGSRELDLRDGAAEAAGMSAKQLQVARTFGNEICETKAMERAIRNFVRQVYTVDELKKPFLIPRSSFTPDMNDPAIKKLVTERAMSGMAAMYPSATPALPPASEPEPETTTAAPAPDPFAATPSTATSAPAQDAPLVDELRITAVDIQNGKSKASGKPWTLYNVTLSSGVIASTFSESMHRVIDEAKKHNLPVTVSTSENERYPDKANLDSITIVDKRQGTLPMAGDAGKY